MKLILATIGAALIFTGTAASLPASGHCTYFVGAGTSTTPCVPFGTGTVTNSWQSTPSHALRSSAGIAVGAIPPQDGVCIRYIRTDGSVYAQSCPGIGQKSAALGGSGSTYVKVQCMLAHFAYKRSRQPASLSSTAVGYCWTAW